MIKIVHHQIMIYLLILLLIFMPGLSSCKQNATDKENASYADYYADIPFIQEIHVAYMISNSGDDNKVRSIAVDRYSNVWIATASGVFLKKTGTRKWDPVITGADRGPAYSVIINTAYLLRTS